MRSIEWLAGILEGEGTFSDVKSGSSGLYRTPLVALGMTDQDVVQEAAKICEVIGGRKIRLGRQLIKSGKISYTIYLTGLPAVRVMLAVLPYLGFRRTARIQAVLAAWNPKKYRQAVALKMELQEQQSSFEE